MVGGGTLWLWQGYGQLLNLETLANQEIALREQAQQRPVAMFAWTFAVYVIITGLSLPGALVATLVVGWFLGFWKGLLLVSFASTLGATIAFSVSRFLLRETIQSRFGDRFVTFNDALESEGAFYLFSLRVIPVVPFFVINLVMGLTPIRGTTFWWVSQLGMLPGTAAFVYAGAQVPSLRHFADNGVRGVMTPGMVIAMVVIGILPILMRKVVGIVKSGNAHEPLSN